MKERQRAEWQLDDVVEQLEPRTVAEPQPELPEPSRRESVAGRQSHILVVEAPEDVADPSPVVGIPLEVPAVGGDQPLVRRAIDVVDRPADR